MTATLPSLAAMKPNPAWASLPLLDRTGWKRVWFGKRRAYQRKVAVAEFEAVVSGDIDVLAPKAFHDLSGLPLIHSKSSHGLSLGQLDFISGRSTWIQPHLRPRRGPRHPRVLAASAQRAR
jgi:hypothetical protein